MIYFSIVIPLYNKQTHIIETLESVKSQNHSNFETIIVNDGSTDKSASIVDEWIHRLDQSFKEKFKIINQANAGVSAARNSGVNYSNYEYIAFLDADDRWEINHLENLNKLIEAFKDKVDIFSNASKKYINNTLISPKLSVNETYFGLLNFFITTGSNHNFINSSSVCVKKTSILEHSFPQNMKNFEDVITWARIANSKGFAFSSEPTSIYVIENIEASSNVDFNNYLRFEQLLKTIDTDSQILSAYKNKLFLNSIMAARIHMPYFTYLKEFLKTFGQSEIVTLYSGTALLVPKFFLKYIKKQRKKQ